MAFKRHFARVRAAERCTESTFTEHQRQVCDYALVYAEKKNDGDAPYSVSFTATQSGDAIVQMHPLWKGSELNDRQRCWSRQSVVSRDVSLPTIGVASGQRSWCPAS